MVEMRNLCNGDFDRPILFVCWDWNLNAKSILVGKFETSVNKLRLRENFQLELAEGVSYFIGSPLPGGKGEGEFWGVLFALVR